MKTRLNCAALLLAACGWAGATFAQPVYRCGDSYSQQPCAGGSQVPAADPRSAAQQAQASAAARRDAKAAEALEQARLKEEAKPAQAYIPPTKAQETTETPKPGKPAVFKATAPAKAKQAPGKKTRKNKKKAV